MSFFGKLCNPEEHGHKPVAVIPLSENKKMELWAETHEEFIKKMGFEPPKDWKPAKFFIMKGEHKGMYGEIWANWWNDDYTKIIKIENQTGYWKVDIREFR